MAEAHSAVAFQLRITADEGLDIDLNHEVLTAVFLSAFRSWWKWLQRVLNQFHNGVYPATPGSFIFTLSCVAMLSVFQVDPFGLCGHIKSWPILRSMDSPYSDGFSAIVAAGLCWLSVVYTARFILRGLLSFRFWMYEPFGRPSLAAKLVFFAIRLLVSRGHRRFFSFQNCLPRQSVPPLKDTLTRYLRSIRALCNDEEYERMASLADEFANGIGPSLQRFLVLKSWLATNYVSDWWEEHVYLRNRGPLIVNCSYYAVDTLKRPQARQAARAAHGVFSMLEFRRLIEREELDPVLVNKTVPLCAAQYERQFNTCRIPGLETDQLVHYADSKHVVVIHRGRFYKVRVHNGDRLFTAAELEGSFAQILANDAENEGDAESKVAALTAGSRVRWAMARQVYFRSGVNRKSLDAIERAAFIVVLSDEDISFDSPPAWDHFAKHMLTGRIYDRWWDKTWNLVVTPNGYSGGTIEHSWGDAPIVAHVGEYVRSREVHSQPGYTDDGHCRGQARCQPPQPQRLRFELGPEVSKLIDEALAETEPLVRDVDLHMFPFDDYGKGLMKRLRISPDCFVQMALQLAFYRDFNKVCLTYEASMTRLFREGRTETIRSCTVESMTFVKSMCQPDSVVVGSLEAGQSANEHRLQLFRASVDRHSILYKDAMNGLGIDRHLFCLLVISKYRGIESPFLQEVLSEPWRLSTSQTPMNQSDWLQNHPDVVWVGGGFGPVANDGYGVSYIFGGEDQLFFHVSSKHSCSETDSHRFGDRIKTALCDIRDMLLGHYSIAAEDKGDHLAAADDNRSN